MSDRKLTIGEQAVLHRALLKSGKILHPGERHIMGSEISTQDLETAETIMRKLYPHDGNTGEYAPMCAAIARALAFSRSEGVRETQAAIAQHVLLRCGVERTMRDMARQQGRADLAAAHADRAHALEEAATAIRAISASDT